MYIFLKNEDKCIQSFLFLHSFCVMVLAVIEESYTYKGFEGKKPGRLRGPHKK